MEKVMKFKSYHQLFVPSRMVRYRVVADAKGYPRALVEAVREAIRLRYDTYQRLENTNLFELLENAYDGNADRAVNELTEDTIATIVSNYFCNMNTVKVETEYRGFGRYVYTITIDEV